jgi:hypothetical protein
MIKSTYRGGDLLRAPSHHFWAVKWIILEFDLEIDFRKPTFAAA